MGSKPPLTVFILANQYVILDSPEPLRDEEGTRCAVQIDHEQRVIWVDPCVAPSRRWPLLIRAVSQAWDERMRRAPLVD